MAQAPTPAREPLTPAEARAIAREAYVFGFPLVDHYRIQHAYFEDCGHPEFKAPWNQVHSEARVYTPADTAIHTPNSDTPYSQLGADLRAEPLVLGMPAVEEGRYWSAQFIDLYTHNFAYTGSRTTGNGGGRFLLAGPDWNGPVPEVVQGVIRAETPWVFVFYRTQSFGADDLENVRRIQSGYTVQPLSAFLGQGAPAAAPRIDFPRPLSREEERTSLAFFGLLNFILGLCPTHADDAAAMQRFARLGIGPGWPFDPDALAPGIREAIEQGRADAWADLRALGQRIDRGELSPQDMAGPRELLQANPLHRFLVAVNGIYAHSKEEALYPAYFSDDQGRTLDGGARRYRLRFAPGQLPPARAFWSMTMYDAQTRQLVANHIDRYLINSAMLPGLQQDADGGLTLHVQHEAPAPGLQSNWLPAPPGRFFIALRLYIPEPQALDGRWQAPALQAVEPVTVDNFVRAESDQYFAASAASGAFGRLTHARRLLPIHKQAVVRGNRDTLYSYGIFDLAAAPVTVTLPDPGSRFLSMILISQDHYVPAVIYAPGRHLITRERVGTRYLMIGIRILVNPKDAADLAVAHALQDAVQIEQASSGQLELPAWDAESQSNVRNALLTLGATLPDLRGAFGRRDHVLPVRHLIGAAMAWGANPDKDATYLVVTPRRNDGNTVHTLSVGEVPVDAFWSVSVYNAQGYFDRNPQEAYTVNNLTARRKPDGSVRIRFGDCEGAKEDDNCLPIMPGWNYMVRFYRPRTEILDGRWAFPEARPYE